MFTQAVRCIIDTINAKDLIMQHEKFHIYTFEIKYHLLALQKIRWLLKKGVRTVHIYGSESIKACVVSDSQFKLTHEVLWDILK